MTKKAFIALADTIIASAPASQRPRWEVTRANRQSRRVASFHLMTTRFLTPSEDSAIRARIARLRSQMFDLSEPEQEEAGRQIRALKAEAEPTWHAQAVQAQAERLARCGF